MTWIRILRLHFDFGALQPASFYAMVQPYNTKWEYITHKEKPPGEKSNKNAVDGKEQSVLSVL